MAADDGKWACAFHALLRALSIRVQLLARSALPIVGLERRGGQTLLVDQVGVCHIAPAEANLGWRGNLTGLDDDRIAIDRRRGRLEFAVGAGDLKFPERLTVSRRPKPADGLPLHPWWQAPRTSCWRHLRDHSSETRGLALQSVARSNLAETTLFRCA
jgi:hypothetical protein